MGEREAVRWKTGQTREKGESRDPKSKRERGKEGGLEETTITGFPEDGGSEHTVRDSTARWKQMTPSDTARVRRGLGGHRRPRALAPPTVARSGATP